MMQHNYIFEIPLITLSIMISVAGISAGLGYALKSKKLRDFGAEELTQVVISSIILGMIVAFFYGGGMFQQIMNSSGVQAASVSSCPAQTLSNPAMCLSYNYLVGSGYTYDGIYHQSIFDSLATLIASLLALSGLLGIIESIKISLVIVSFSFSQVFSPIISEIKYVVGMLSGAEISVLVQGSLMLFSSAATTSILLPVGFILRTTYPTRKIGSFIIALAVSLYIVFPMSYLLDIIVANGYQASYNSHGYGLGSILNESESLKTSLNGATTSNSIAQYGIVGEIESQASSIQSMFSSYINSLLIQLSYFIAYSFILPLFSLVLTGVSIREISSILGSEEHFDVLSLM